MLLSANAFQTPAARNVVDAVFNSLGMCWSLLETTERLLMEWRRGQYLQAEHAQNVAASMGELENKLEFANLGATIIEREILGQVSVTVEFSQLRGEILAQQQAAEKASPPVVDTPELVSFQCLVLFDVFCLQRHLTTSTS
jgi:hypothetical protein